MSVFDPVINFGEPLPVVDGQIPAGTTTLVLAPRDYMALHDHLRALSPDSLPVPTILGYRVKMSPFLPRGFIGCARADGVVFGLIDGRPVSRWRKLVRKCKRFLTRFLARFFTWS